MITIIWGDEFTSSYLSLGNNRSIMNTELHTTSMLALIGTCLRGVDIDIKGAKVDTRLHPLIIQRSGSGKDEVFNLCRDIAHKAGIKFVSQSNLTTAAFIGSAGKNREPVPGIASNSDILAFKEISSLFYAASQDHSSDLLNLMNQAMDYGGYVKKDLGGMSGSIEYRTAVSLLGTTYPPRSKLFYIESGFLPRTLFGYKEVGKKFYMSVADWLFDNVGEPEEARDTVKVDQIAETLRFINFNKTNFKFSFPEKRTFHALKNTVEEQLSKYPIRIQQSVEPAITRLSINSIKVAACFAAIDNMSHNVTSAHIEKACKFMEYSINGLLNFHSRYDTLVDSDTQITRMIIQRLKDDGKTETDIQELAKMSGGMSLRNISNTIETLAVTGELKETVELSGGKPRKRILIL